MQSPSWGLSLATMDTTALVIAEHGTDWVGWARRLRGDGRQTVVLMQDRGERPDAFAKRALSRVERLINSGAAILEAAFVSSEGDTDAQHRERSRIVRALSSLLSRNGGARIYLDPASRPSQSGYRMMRALAWALTDLAKGSGMTISVVGTGGQLLN